MEATGLTFRPSDGRLYWPVGEEIHSITTNGSDHRTMTVEARVRSSVIIMDERFYFSGSRQADGVSLLSGDIRNGSSTELVKTGIQLTDGAACGKELGTSLASACAVNNGGCSQLCFPNGKKRTCACEDHYKLDREQKCLPPSQFLLLRLD